MTAAPEASPAPEAPDTAPAPKTRRPRDMAISLLVLLIPVFAVVWMYRTLYGGDTVVTVDPSEAIGSAQRAGLTQLPPATAPQGWFIVSAHFRDGYLRIGYLNQDQQGVQLVQGRGELPRPAERHYVGRSADMTVMLVTAGADVAPLAKLLPIPVSVGEGG
ncbi:DUF4245 family protein [Allorhizocola rhizosphaerae]|uniref:DUF4245 family protein n=1 Tax=Allorhizocola rhizosphaerae TaxID=1872709 RepID=UPI0013C3513F|nr:DUF4245 family protein [Allorhizocola rhizosphaerae]